ncbi:hypothetical protein M3647_21200 [Paenibacillus cellulositrophicus]|uniref:hypothetical protein n=1 Tax=Paenibacillus cellulositrophicus TaxID=562959 RepID=UPI00203A755E|nr:hypothetical protein [Paenibacillus cellulositrophicus]MCM2999995.1 hypothetical protein [Paenibacillus cellulositrophicus]
MNAAAILKKFICINESSPSLKNEKLLLNAYELIKKELIDTNYSIERVRLAHKIFGYLGDKGLHERIEAMRKYLQSNQPKSPEDQFWANWELVDNLALLKKYKMMIEEQRLFLAWAQKNMSLDHLLKVMYDSTQAIGWVEEGRSDEWFEIYYDLMNRVKPTESNRNARVLYAETATGLLLFNLNKYPEATVEIKRYSDIVHEDDSWIEYIKFLMRLRSFQLELYSAQGDWLNYEKTVNEAILEFINNINRHNNNNDSVSIDDICDMAHEIGTCLMWEKRYKQAMPLFEFAIQNQGTGITHYFYAICVWATQKNRKATLENLKLAEMKVKGNGGLRSRYKKMFLEQKEFSDVWEDDEFLSVFLINH